MTGSIAFNEEKLSSIIIKNNTTNDIIINIGIASSEESAENIEYLGGKHLITGSENEVDYYLVDSVSEQVYGPYDFEQFNSEINQKQITMGNWIYSSEYKANINISYWQFIKELLNLT